MLIGVLFLSIPTLWELWDDHKGDLNKRYDVAIRVGLMIGISSGLYFGDSERFNFFACLNLSVAIFFMFFDYAINIILYHNNVIDYANWFSYTGKSGVVDNIGFWRKMNPWGKFAIRLGYFILAIILYVTI